MWWNRIYTVFLGDMVKEGEKFNTRVDHFTILRTIGYVLGVGSVGRKGDTITTIWK